MINTTLIGRTETFRFIKSTPLAPMTDAEYGVYEANAQAAELAFDIEDEMLQQGKNLLSLKTEIQQAGVRL